MAAWAAKWSLENKKGRFRGGKWEEEEVRWGEREGESVTAAQRGRAAGGSVESKYRLICSSLICRGSLPLSLSHLGLNFQSASYSRLIEGRQGVRHTLINTHNDLHTALAEAISSSHARYYYFLMILAARSGDLVVPVNLSRQDVKAKSKERNKIKKCCYVAAMSRRLRKREREGGIMTAQM